MAQAKKPGDANTPRGSSGGPPGKKQKSSKDLLTVGKQPLDELLARERARQRAGFDD
jgi:hypothetical protein